MVSQQSLCGHQDMGLAQGLGVRTMGGNRGNHNLYLGLERV